MPAMFQEPMVTRPGGVVGERRQREQIGLDDVAGDDRHDADEEQRNHRRDAQDLGRVGRAQDAAVLDELDREQDRRARG